MQEHLEATEQCSDAGFAGRDSAQLRWLLAATDHLPVSENEIRGHFDPGYLAAVSPTALNQWLQGLTSWLEAPNGGELFAVKVDEPSMVVGIVSGGGAGPRARVKSRSSAAV